MSLEKVEQKNIDRAASLVAKTRRLIERNLEAWERKNEELADEHRRHGEAVKNLEAQAASIKEEHRVLEADLAEAEEYLKALTIEKAKN